MKKFLGYLLIIILFSTWGIILTNRDSVRKTVETVRKSIVPPCSRSIKYSIGSIDPKFNLSEAELKSVLVSAEDIWEKPAGQNLFQYDATSDFRINLIFDERQERTIEQGKLEEKLGGLETARDSLKKEYDRLHANYKKRLDDYDKTVSDYRKRLEKFNAEVDSWNKKGGAPPDVYEDLKKEKEALKETYDKIEKERKAINDLAGKTNVLVEKEGDLVSTYNSSISTYKNKYGQSSAFDKGIYDGQKIDIFQFREISDLRLTLAHEMGHALGIDHLNNSKSIMYYLMGDQDMENPALSEEDLAAFKNVCKKK